MAVQISGNDITVPRDGSFTRNVTIGGTLTYEDVTNIDSVGLVTARTGIEIGARPGVAASISVDGNMIVSGISTFNGRVLLGTTVEGEATADNLTVAGSGHEGITIRSGTSHFGSLFFSDGTSGTDEYKGSVEYNHNGDYLSLRSAATERLRIDANGLIANGALAPSSYGSPNLLISGTDSTFTLMGNGSTNNTSFTGIKFRVAGTSSGDYTKAAIFSRREGGYNDLSLIFALDTVADATSVSIADEKMRINSSGKIGINQTSPYSEVDITSSVEDSTGTLSAHGIRLGAIGATDEQVIPITAGFKSQQDRARAGIGFISKISGSSEGYAGAIGFYTKSAADGSGLLRTNERVRIAEDGNVKIGATANRDLGGLSVQRLHIEGTDGGGSGIGVVNNQNSAGFPSLRFAKSRGTSVGSNTIVANNDPLGGLIFCGADGSDMVSVGAEIKSFVDGTPGSNDMPGRLVFATTADGAATATPRMEINSAGIVTCRSIPSFKISIGTDASPNSGTVSENNGHTLRADLRDAFNEGNHFDEATGRFTAPVEGLYFFHFSLMRYSSNGTGSIEMRIKKNGSQIWARAYKASYLTSFASEQLSTITQMKAGHYVEFTIGADMSTYDDDSYMLGYLIG